ncbi:MAG: hypothetical protein B6244_09305 [Candidatus Cloacimonetes bacterium 4572_55]|nr:MAG: hypothetical protein B6244_09305 [Candidatus Cloacimonetes bacterium 4572_55]
MNKVFYTDFERLKLLNGTAKSMQIPHFHQKYVVNSHLSDKKIVEFWGGNMSLVEATLTAFQ